MRGLKIPAVVIAKMAIASLKDSTKMYTSYDVGKQLDRKRGYLDLDNYDYATLFGTTLVDWPLSKVGATDSSIGTRLSPGVKTKLPDCSAP